MYFDFRSWSSAGPGLRSWSEVAQGWVSVSVMVNRVDTSSCLSSESLSCRKPEVSNCFLPQHPHWNPPLLLSSPPLCPLDVIVSRPALFSLIDDALEGERGRQGLLGDECVLLLCGGWCHYVCVVCVCACMCIYICICTHTYIQTYI